MEQTTKYIIIAFTIIIGLYIGNMLYDHQSEELTDPDIEIIEEGGNPFNIPTYKMSEHNVKDSTIEQQHSTIEQQKPTIEQQHSTIQSQPTTQGIENEIQSYNDNMYGGFTSLPGFEKEENTNPYQEIQNEISTPFHEETDRNGQYIYLSNTSPQETNDVINRALQL